MQCLSRQLEHSSSMGLVLAWALPWSCAMALPSSWDIPPEPAVPSAPLPGGVGSSFPHSVPLLSLSTLGHGLAGVGLGFAVLRVLPKEAQHQSCSLQMCPGSVFTACLGLQLCQTPVVQFVHLALPFPSQLNGSEDSASGLLSCYSVLSPPLSWRVLLKTLV